MASTKTTKATTTTDKKTTKTKATTKAVAVPAPTQAPVEEPTLTLETQETQEDGVEKKRVVITKDIVIKSFEDLIAQVEAEITSLREGDTKSKGVKFLRTVNKKIKQLKLHASKVMKQKKGSSNRKNTNNNSGFLKPVKISKEMAKFTGWNADEPQSRVDVTKFICNYIKENNLQNPVDKRQILADSKLAKLLRYDSKKEELPLTYYRIQTHLKPHFIKPEVEGVTA